MPRWPMSAELTTTEDQLIEILVAQALAGHMEPLTVNDALWTFVSDEFRQASWDTKVARFGHLQALHTVAVSQARQFVGAMA